MSSLPNITMKYFVIRWFTFNCNRKFQLTLKSAGRKGTEKKFPQDITKGKIEKNLWSGVQSHDNHHISPSQWTIIENLHISVYLCSEKQVYIILQQTPLLYKNSLKTSSAKQIWYSWRPFFHHNKSLYSSGKKMCLAKLQI